MSIALEDLGDSYEMDFVFNNWVNFLLSLTYSVYSFAGSWSKLNSWQTEIWNEGGCGGLSSKRIAWAESYYNIKASGEVTFCEQVRPNVDGYKIHYTIYKWNEEPDDNL
ncbi:hypothetical protein [Photobacterium leiognathi]|uniref:hypothetical protein n=1 Tax=Photobacterium leiognathi TaxID=553611 RepID=UPI00273A29BD|nr:hypothetical protein [Photobacterium leiognathi]